MLARHATDVELAFCRGFWHCKRQCQSKSSVNEGCTLPVLHIDWMLSWLQVWCKHRRTECHIMVVTDIYVHLRHTEKLGDWGATAMTTHLFGLLDQVLLCEEDTQILPHIFPMQPGWLGHLLSISSSMTILQCQMFSVNIKHSFIIFPHTYRTEN